MRFENKVAVITGAGQGIGETYAKRIASEGAKVVIAELNEEQGRRVASEIGEAAIFVKTDVSDPASCQALADAAMAAFGGVDYLINNAAIFAGMRYEPLMSVDIDYYMKFMAVNLHGALFVTRAIRSTSFAWTPKHFSPSATSNTSLTADDNGINSVKVVPSPTSLSTSTTPPMFVIWRRTMSIPMPRPLISVTSSRVLKPGSKINASAC